MIAQRLKIEYKQIIMKDHELSGKISNALSKSVATVAYRMVPYNDERLTMPRIQAIIRQHLNISETVELTETYEKRPGKAESNT
jgi:hypothetical protein